LQITAESGADTEEHFKLVAAVNLGVTFKQQAEWFMAHVQARKRRPIKPATAKSWQNCVTKWLNPTSWCGTAFCCQQSGSQGTGLTDGECKTLCEVNPQLRSNRKDGRGISNE
jgi:hypothetical protein